MSVDYETLMKMFNSMDSNDIILAEGIFLNFTDEEISEFLKWGWANGYSRIYHPSVKINERLWGNLKILNNII